MYPSRRLATVGGVHASPSPNVDNVSAVRPGPSIARILIVDDDESICLTLAKQLSPLGFTVETDTDAAGAIERIAQNPPDVLLLDYMMPGVDGLAVLRALRSHPRCMRMPILMVTAIGDRASAVAALTTGADDYLVKPVHGHELRARVSNLAKVAAYQHLLSDQRAAAQLELEGMKDALLKLDRLASLGTFAAGVGHELNNIITVLASYTNLIAQNAAEGKPPDAEHIVGLRDTCRHVAHHARAVLDLGSIRTVEVERLDLAEIARHVIHMLKVAGRTKRAIILDLPSTALWCRFSRTSAEQVLINLLVNAVDAVALKPAAAVCVKLRMPSPAEIVCTVSDEGEGMSPETLAKATQAFFTTKPAGKGTGLGLAVVKRLIEAAGGTFEISSEVGVGTQVTWRLSAAPD